MTRKHRSAAPAVTPDGFVPGSTLDRRATVEVAARFASGTYNATTRTVEALISTGARVRRWGIFEELAITPEAIDLGRVAQGQVRLLDSHEQDSIDDVLGVVLRVWIADGQLLAEIRFADTQAGRNAEAMVSSGDISGVSIGYRVMTWSIVQVEDEVEVWRAANWELMEVSLVAVPADPAAMIRAAAPAESVTHMENVDMRRNTSSADAPAPVPVTQTTTAPVAQVETRAAPQAETAAVLAAERTRVAAINDIARRSAMPDADRDAALSAGTTVEAFRAAAFDRMAGAAEQTRTSSVQVQQDETETRRVHMQEALTRGISAIALPGDWSAGAQAYREMSLVDLAAERLGVRRVPSTIAGREDILSRAMHSTDDFPIIFQNSLNRVIGARYALAPSLYREIAVRQDFNDFRPHETVTAGDFPMLAPIGEGGKISYGTFGEKKETVAVAAYARAIAISRQMMVNDRLGALDDVLGAYGDMIALFEDQTFFAMKAANAGDGPSLLEGAAAMFTTVRTNKATVATAITITGVAAGRAAMRKYKSIDSNLLTYNAPEILLVSPDKETEAEQFVAAVQPQQNSNVNPFSGKLRVLVSQQLSGNAWELYTSPTRRANFRWGLLSGYTAPRIRLDNPFGQQGSAMSIEHDFGTGGIDWRAGYRNAGA